MLEEINYCLLVIERKHIVSFRTCVISRTLAQKSDNNISLKNLIISLISANQLLSTPAAHWVQNTDNKCCTQRYQFNELTQESLRITNLMIQLVRRNQLVSHADKNTGVVVIAIVVHYLWILTQQQFDNTNWIPLTKITSVSEIITKFVCLFSCFAELSIVTMSLWFDLRQTREYKDTCTKHVLSRYHGVKFQVVSNVTDNKFTRKMLDCSLNIINASVFPVGKSCSDLHPVICSNPSPVRCGISTDYLRIFTPFSVT